MTNENTSGGGGLAAVPARIDRWNWGAFLLNWIWGIGNGTFIALLMFVPLVNIAMPFVLGARGSAWAWRNKRWESVEQFEAVQRQWARWALVVYALFGGMIVALVVFIGGLLRDSEPYKLAKAELVRNVEVQAAFGSPVSAGTPSGNFEVSGPDGTAHFQFSIEGPDDKGTAYVEARKRLGRWELTGVAVDEEKNGLRIPVK
jgi:hypothetical protein